MYLKLSDDQQYIHDIDSDTWYKAVESGGSCLHCVFHQDQTKSNKLCINALICGVCCLSSDRDDKKNVRWEYCSKFIRFSSHMIDNRSEFDKMVCEALLN